MVSHISDGADTMRIAGISLADLPKSNVFTSRLPSDPAFESPESSHKASREALGPRLVKGAMYTFVRPEAADEPELLGVSPKAMEDIGLRAGEEQTSDFKAVVAGNKILWSEKDGGIYPWAQCYGGLSCQ
jgi:serine/tyrosine/threonine adenylyltransferase